MAPVALLAAGVIAATPTVVAPVVHHAAPAVSSAAVQPVSFITDALNGLASLVDVGTGLTEAGVKGVAGLPVYGAAALVESLTHLNLAPSVLSYITQLYLNPALGGSLMSQLFDEGRHFAALLPYPLGPSGTKGGILVDALNGTASTIGNVFTALPSVVQGEARVTGFLLDTDPGRLVLAAGQAILSVVQAGNEVVSWAAHLPAVLEASLESAIRKPGDIPGLVSNVVNGVLGPYGLVSIVARTLAVPLFLVPVIGTGVQKFVLNVVDNLTGFVARLLPAPVQPTPFAAAAAAATKSESAAPAAAIAGRPADLPGKQRHDRRSNRVVAQTGAVDGDVALKDRGHAHMQPAASGITQDKVIEGKAGKRDHRGIRGKRTQKHLH